mmetsp:Transcript_6022/g.14018  ORF Transcript_6022/g.14018 Transcript_6022/m.14018 type:complete len:263 (-) Transcript_6022:854-1642(-)
MRRRRRLMPSTPTVQGTLTWKNCGQTFRSEAWWSSPESRLRRYSKASTQTETARSPSPSSSTTSASASCPRRLCTWCRTTPWRSRSFRSKLPSRRRLQHTRRSSSSLMRLTQTPRALLSLTRCGGTSRLATAASPLSRHRSSLRASTSTETASSPSRSSRSTWGSTLSQAWATLVPTSPLMRPRLLPRSRRRLPLTRSIRTRRDSSLSTTFGMTLSSRATRLQGSRSKRCLLRWTSMGTASCPWQSSRPPWVSPTILSRRLR